MLIPVEYGYARKNYSLWRNCRFQSRVWRMQFGKLADRFVSSEASHLSPKLNVKVESQPSNVRPAPLNNAQAAAKSGALMDLIVLNALPLA